MDIQKSQEGNIEQSVHTINSSKEFISLVEQYYETSPITFSDPSPCFDTIAKDTCIFIGTRDTIIDIGCGDCKAHVIYNLWVCSYLDPSSFVLTSSVVIDSFSAVPYDDGGCDSLLNSWQALIDAGNTSGLQLEMNKFINKARDAVEFLEISDFLDDLKNIFWCGNDDAIAVVEFNVKACNTTCARLFPPDIQRTSCGVACCKRTTQYCWDLFGQKVVKGDLVIETPAIICTGANNSCPSGYYNLGFCFKSCF